MRAPVSIILAFALFCCQPLLSWAGDCIPVKSLKEADLAYTSGEHLDFVISYNWGMINTDVGAATVDLETVEMAGQKAFHVSVLGKTVRWYDKIFKVREDFQSWFTVDGVVPLRFTRNTLEGKYEARNDYNYLWSLPEPCIQADVYSSSSGQRNLQLPLDKCTFDLPALFFLARNMDFDTIEPDRQYPMTFAIDDDVYNVYFIWKKRETIKVKGLGQVSTICFAAKLLAGSVFTGEQDMLIWVTDDDNRVPVYFEAPILVGVVKGRLTDWSGLKHPFSSMTGKKKKNRN